ncbi:MAG: hypothetical protein Q9160_005762 [Pyrenula sp. 1 TL-2023]
MKFSIVAYLIAACVTILPVSALPKENSDVAIRADTVQNINRDVADVDKLPPKLWCGSEANSQICGKPPYDYSCHFGDYTIFHNSSKPEGNVVPRENIKRVDFSKPLVDHLWAAICHQDSHHICANELQGACDDTSALHRITQADFKQAFEADSACNSRCHCFHLETSQRVQKRYVAPEEHGVAASDNEVRSDTSGLVDDIE